MTNPTSDWDKVPVSGTYKLLGGGYDSGSLTFTLSERIIAADGTGIYARGQSITKAIDENGQVSINFPASDDPDISPTGWQIKVTENLDSKGGQTYYIEPKLSDIANGFNLNKVVVSSDAPAAPPPVYMRGEAGGIAGLDTDGDVINAAGAKVTGGAATSFSSLSDTDMTGVTAGQAPVYDGTVYKPKTVPASLGDLTDVADLSSATSGQFFGTTDGTTWGAVDAPAGGGGADSLADLTDVSDLSGATAGQFFGTVDGSTWGPQDLAVDADNVTGLDDVAKSGDYGDLSNTPTIPSTVGEIAGAVPDTRTVNGKPLSADVTVGINDIADAPAVAKTGAYSDLTGAPNLALVATSGDINDLNGVDLDGATDGQTMLYDLATSTWKPGTVSGGTGAVDSVNGQTGTVSLDVTDISGAVPDTRTVNGKPLSADVTIGTTDISGLQPVATSGAYSDLTGTPSLTTVATTGAYSDLTGKPNLAIVATSGDYNDLTNPPTIPTTAADVGAPALDGDGKISTSVLPAGLTVYNVEVSGTYPADPNPAGMTVWVGADNPGPGGLGLMKANDLWMQVTA